MALALDERTGTLIAATNAGLFRLADGETVWTPANAGLSTTRMVSLAAHRTAGVVYAGTMGGGVFRSEDGGLNWQATGAGLDDARMRSVAYDLGTGALVAAVEQRGAFRSADGGSAWSPANVGLPELAAQSVADDGAGASLALLTAQAAYESTDGALAWQPHPPSLSGVLDLILPVNAYGFAARLPGGERIWAAQGGGQLWASLAASLSAENATITPDGQGRVQAVYGAQLAQSDPDVVYGRVPLLWMAIRIWMWNAFSWLSRTAPWWWAVAIGFLALAASILAVRRNRLSVRFGVPIKVGLFKPAQSAAYARPIELERAWPKWERAVKEELYTYGDVKPSDLRSVPGPFRRYAQQRFVDVHGAQSAIELKGRLLVTTAGANLFAWSAALRQLRRQLRRQRFAWLHRDKADRLAAAFAARSRPCPRRRLMTCNRRAPMCCRALPIHCPRDLALVLVADAEPGARTVQGAGRRAQHSET